jgi:hypothetical protein
MSFLHARASRTTHPQTIGRLGKLFTLIAEGEFEIERPLLWHTKTEVLELLKRFGHEQLIPSSVSCSRTFTNLANSTHCGACFQCLDRRIAVFAAELDDIDNPGLYATDIVFDSIPTSEQKTTVVDYLRQAKRFAEWNPDHFQIHVMDDLQQLLYWIPEYPDEVALVESVWDLCSRHGAQVRRALLRMRAKYEDPFSRLRPDCLLQLINDREFLRDPISRLITAVEERLSRAIPKMFRSIEPKNEHDLNDKIHALLDEWRDALEREHPDVPFAGAGVIPDFSLNRGHVLVEGKYIRKSTTPSKVTDGISADLIKYSQEAHILFVVYDPHRRIPDPDRFKHDLESRGRCTVMVLS